jgi:hypothetical protein
MSNNHQDKRNVLNLCSLRATRRILKHHWYWDIPEDAVVEVNKLFNNILNAVAECIVKCHVSGNEELERYGLRPRCRLTVYKNFSNSLLKCVADVNMGTTGGMNRNTVVSNKADIEVA